MRLRRALLAPVLALSLACAHAPPSPPVTWKQIAAMPLPPPDRVIRYGSDSLAFGELRLPRGKGSHPLAIVVHGGCWRSEYDLHHVSHLSAALARRGVAAWTLEYRRIGNDGGGWTGTFDDVARGTDHARILAEQFPLDLERVVLIGHSAGGHLALWLAARRNLPRDGPLAAGDPLPVRGVVSLAGITDLKTYGAGSGFCNESVALLLGGTVEQVPERYARASPIELLPLGVPTRLLHGATDSVVPLEQSQSFAERATARGDDARVVALSGAGHFDLIAPSSPAWVQVERALLGLLANR